MGLLSIMMDSQARGGFLGPQKEALRKPRQLVGLGARPKSPSQARRNQERVGEFLQKHLFCSSSSWRRDRRGGEAMAPTLGSSLVLSGTTLLFKAILGLTTKSVHVEGLPILLEALREPAVIANGKGKEKERAVDIRIDQPERPRLRRGIVTGLQRGSQGFMG